MEINIWAVVVSALASIVIGSIWFGPLFGKQFMNASGMSNWTPEQRAAATKAMGISYGIQVVASLVMFYILARFIVETGELTLQSGLMTGFLAWLGFILPIKISDTIWGGSRKLAMLTAGNQLVNLLVAGAIIGAW